MQRQTSLSWILPRNFEAKIIFQLAKPAELFGYSSNRTCPKVQLEKQNDAFAHIYHKIK